MKTSKKRLPKLTVAIDKNGKKILSGNIRLKSEFSAKVKTDKLGKVRLSKSFKADSYTNETSWSKLSESAQFSRMLSDFATFKALLPKDTTKRQWRLANFKPFQDYLESQVDAMYTAVKLYNDYVLSTYPEYVESGQVKLSEIRVTEKLYKAAFMAYLHKESFIVKATLSDWIAQVDEQIAALELVAVE